MILRVIVHAVRGEMVLVHNALESVVIFEKRHLPEVISDSVRRKERLSSRIDAERREST